MKYRDLIRILEQDGWQHVGTAGSHRVYRHPDKDGRGGFHRKRCTDRDPEFHFEAGRIEKLMNIAEYTVIYERAQDGSWGAYAPDLPALGVVGETREEVERLIRQGIEIYIEELHNEGKSAPAPGTRSAVVRISV